MPVSSLTEMNLQKHKVLNKETKASCTNKTTNMAPKTLIPSLNAVTLQHHFIHSDMINCHTHHLIHPKSYLDMM